ncbi:MAG: nicotinate-nucleotide--dimethylbenzimidazole phosphoribosyltransferase [Firmicutes bacterium]|nr:nicotinate-nucleotide--dimethylbenzimidazole phosphoribosyltransferase [Bacillota bacterium]
MSYEEQLYEKIGNISGVDREAEAKARSKWDAIAKPLDGLGRFERIIEKIAGIMGSAARINFRHKAVVVMCADNGVVEEGVTQTDSSVTAAVASNISSGFATVNTMAEMVKADVISVDMGINTELNNQKILDYKVDFGTGNIAKGPAMTREQACLAILNGIEIINKLKDRGYNIFAVGEMGIGNTTTTSAVASVLTGLSPDAVTGRGAGLPAETLNRKLSVIKRAIEVNKPDGKDALDILSKVGGFDIAGMVGVFLGGAICRRPVIIDGAISSAAAVLAKMLCPQCVDFMIPSHLGKEPAASYLMKMLELEPVIYGEMALGEGTGAVMMMSLLDIAASVYNRNMTFDDINMESYRRFDS